MCMIIVVLNGDSNADLCDAAVCSAQGPNHRPQARIFQAFPASTVALKTAWVIHINFTKSSVVWRAEKNWSFVASHQAPNF